MCTFLNTQALAPVCEMCQTPHTTNGKAGDVNAAAGGGGGGSYPAAPPPSAAAADDSSASYAPPLDGSSASPWRLYRTVDLGDGAGNEGAVTLRDIIRGPRPDWVVISNYMIDPTWLTTAWPDLANIPRVVLFNGDGVRGFPRNVDVHPRKPKDLKWEHPRKHTAWYNDYGCQHAKFFL